MKKSEILRFAQNDNLARSATSLQLIFPSAISSHATLGRAPRLGRVTQPGLRNKTRPRLSLRGTCVWPCKRTSTPSGDESGGICCRRNFNPPRTRSTTNGHSKLISSRSRVDDCACRRERRHATPVWRSRAYLSDRNLDARFINTKMRHAE